jgi:peptide/nickel transport system substrate-binding protein
MLRRIVLAMFCLLLIAVPITAQDEGGEDVPTGGTVTVLLQNADTWTRNFNPYAPPPQEGISRDLVFEPLMMLNPADYENIIPWLATEYSYSDDLATLTYTLREGVQWSDGEAFSAEDVVFTFEMIQNFPALDTTGVLPLVGSVSAPDETTVVVELTGTNSQAHNILSAINPVPEHQWAEVEDPVTFTNENPVGTGPFTEVSRFEDQVFELCRNPNYWQEDRPYVECIQVPAYVGNQDALLMILDGDTDWGGIFIPNVEDIYTSQSENYNYYYAPIGPATMLYINTLREPMNDVEFRRALSAGINYEQVMELGFGGIQPRASVTGLTAVAADWISEDAEALALDNGYGFTNLEGAAEMLDEAGYVDADGDGFRNLPNGDPFEIELMVVNGFTDWVSSAQIMAQNWNDLGINVNAAPVELGTLSTNLATAQYDISFGLPGIGPTPYNLYRGILFSGLINEEGLTRSAFPRLTDPEIDQLLNDFTLTADREEQQAIVEQLQMFFVEQVPAIPLATIPIWYHYNTTDFTGFPTEDDYYAQANPRRGNTNQSRLLILTNLRPIE